MSSYKKDHLELFHDYGIYIPTRTIFLDTSSESDGHADGVNYEMSKKFIKNFHHLIHLNKDPITIILNSAGGDVIEGMAIYDTIVSAKNCHVTVKVIGQAQSMGSLILQAADERIVSAHSIIMFHAGSGGVGAYNPYEVANSAEFDKKYMDRVYKIWYNKINEKRELLKQAPMAWKTFENMNLKGRYLTAQEAVDLGLADKIEE
jgi:ATP-dependent protease ClpP protease subunit